jgi:hypothetical protein
MILVVMATVLRIPMRCCQVEHTDTQQRPQLETLLRNEDQPQWIVPWNSLPTTQSSPPTYEEAMRELARRQRVV